MESACKSPAITGSSPDESSPDESSPDESSTDGSSPGSGDGSGIDIKVVLDAVPLSRRRDEGGGGEDAGATLHSSHPQQRCHVHFVLHDVAPAQLL